MKEFLSMTVLNILHPSVLLPVIWTALVFEVPRKFIVFEVPRKFIQNCNLFSISVPLIMMNKFYSVLFCLFGAADRISLAADAVKVLKYKKIDRIRSG